MHSINLHTLASYRRTDCALHTLDTNNRSARLGSTATQGFKVSTQYCASVALVPVMEFNCFCELLHRSPLKEVCINALHAAQSNATRPATIDRAVILAAYIAASATAVLAALGRARTREPTASTAACRLCGCGCGCWCGRGRQFGCGCGCVCGLNLATNMLTS